MSFGGLVGTACAPPAVPERASRAARTASAAAMSARSPSGAAADCAGRPCAHPVVVGVPKRPSTASSIISATASRRVRIVQLRERALEPGVRLQMYRPRRLLDAGARAVSRTRSAVASAGTILMLSSRAAWLSANCPIAASDSGTCQEQLDALRRRSVPGRRRSAASNHRAALAGARSAAASPASRRVATAAASPWRAASSTWCARAVAERTAGEQPLGAALVRAQPPPAGRRLVDGSADERMAETEAPRDVRVAHEVEPEQLVERVERRRLGQLRCGRDELRIERVAGDGRALEHPPCLSGEQSELLGERCGHGGRDLHPAQ